MKTTVKFLSEKYGNYQDRYYVSNYQSFINSLQSKVKFSSQVNLGVADGVIIENNFNGDFSNINMAIVEHEDYGTHLYKIIKRSFIKKNLWRITMVKDLISAKYNEIIDSKVLVSRLGMDRTQFNPILLNQESMQLSEIKKEQILLETSHKGLFGYVCFWSGDSLQEGNTGLTVKSYDFTESDMEVSGIDNFLSTLQNRRTLNDINGRITLNRIMAIPEETRSKTSLMPEITEEGIDVKYKQAFTAGYYVGHSYPIYDRYEAWIANQIEPFGFGLPDEGNLYDKMVVTDISVTPNKHYVINRNVTRISKQLTMSLYDLSIILFDTYDEDLVKTDDFREVVVNYDEVTYTATEVTIGNNQRYVFNRYSMCDEQPIKAFFIPMHHNNHYFSYKIGNVDSEQFGFDRSKVEQFIADLMRENMGDAGKLLDVQLVSYPTWDVLYRVVADDGGDWYKLTVPKDIIWVDDYPVTCYEIKMLDGRNNVEINLEIDDYKVEAKKKYVLTSPSGSNNYEFSVAKNGGVRTFYIDYNYRPYGCFYRVRPKYEGLYGDTFNDTRGLIWVEDMGLTQISSAFESYRRQNVNYMAAFDRNIEYERSELSLNASANWSNFKYDAGKRMIEASVEGAKLLASATAADAWFGVKGAAAGGLGAAAVVGGQAAMEIIEGHQLAYNNRQNKRLLENKIANDRDQFNMQLGNIKAIPENVSKVSGVYVTNERLPYLQVFSPSDEEIEYFTSYLDRYGVNVGMMVDLKDYEFDYLQGAILQFSEPITNEEYEEMVGQLSLGVRKYV